MLNLRQEFGGLDLPSLVEYQVRQHIRMMCGDLCAGDHVAREITHILLMLQQESSLT